MAFSDSVSSSVKYPILSHTCIGMEIESHDLEYMAHWMFKDWSRFTHTNTHTHVHMHSCKHGYTHREWLQIWNMASKEGSKEATVYHWRTEEKRQFIGTAYLRSKNILLLKLRCLIQSGDWEEKMHWTSRSASWWETLHHTWGSSQASGQHSCSPACSYESERFIIPPHVAKGKHTSGEEILSPSSGLWDSMPVRIHSIKLHLTYQSTGHL